MPLKAWTHRHFFWNPVLAAAIITNLEIKAIRYCITLGQSQCASHAFPADATPIIRFRSEPPYAASLPLDDLTQ
jgi:hypothetical protein